MYNVDTNVITEEFEIGVDVLSVISETVTEGCIDFEVMSTLDEFEWHMLNVEGVQSVRGLAGVARQYQCQLERGQPQVADVAPEITTCWSSPSLRCRPAAAC